MEGIRRPSLSLTLSLSLRDDGGVSAVRPQIAQPNLNKDVVYHRGEDRRGEQRRGTEVGHMTGE